MQQKIVVTEKLTPEEVEEWKINSVYQEAYKLQEQNDCAGAIDKYHSVVIPMAEQAKFEVPRNKFLFLSYRGIGDCYLSLRRFAEAEEMYQKTFEYVQVWPGIDDSAYSINYRSIGLARMAQQNWKGAEEVLQKAVTILDQQIERSLHSSDVAQTEDVDNLRMSQDLTLNYLAAVYYREQRAAEALSLLEKAYHQATTYNAPATVVKKIVETGLTISTVAGDTAASDIWFQRSKALKKSSH